jgi:hypothetical protein
MAVEIDRAATEEADTTAYRKSLFESAPVRAKAEAQKKNARTAADLEETSGNKESGGTTHSGIKC